MAVPEGALLHAHELIFGHALAVIGGFLLTRVSGPALLAIAAAWVAARVAHAVPDPPVLLRAALSVAATAAIALPAARAFLRGAKRAGSMVFPAILLGLVVAEALFQLGETGALPRGPEAGLRLGLGLVVLLIAAMGGRLVGAAASGAAQRSGGARIAPRPWLERALLLLLAAGFAAEALGAPRPLGPGLLGAGGALIGVRLLSWAPGLRRSAGDVLAVAAGQGWLCVGLLAWAAAALGAVPVAGSAALHLAAIGGIGGTTLVMTMRATAQREARPMPVRAAPAVAGLMGAAALLRGLGPPGLHLAAALLWALATLVAAASVFGRR
jgi:uncharacterized protein involved in response to NO